MIGIKFITKDGKLIALDKLLKIVEGSLSFLSHAEREIHEGHSFTVQAVDDTLDDAATLNIAFKTGDGDKIAHFLCSCTTLVGGSLKLYEAPTWTTNTGTATTIYNRYRSENPLESSFLEDKTATPDFTATNKVLVNVTGLAGGTELMSRYSWGEKGKVESGDYRAINEWLLKPNTQYAVLFTAIGASNKAQIFLNWTEH